MFGRLHVVPLVSEFLRRYPRIDVAHAAGRSAYRPHRGGSRYRGADRPLPDSTLIATRVGAIRQVTCASPAYLARAACPTPHELADHACITFSARDARDGWPLRGKKRERVRVHSRLIVNTAEAAIDAAKAGVGITRVLSYQAAAALADGSLKEILRGTGAADIPISILHREDRLAQTKVQAFVAFAGAALRKRIPSPNANPAKRKQR